MSAPASWKKVIVSGSSAQLNQLSVDTNVNITGSLNASSTVKLSGLTNTSQPNIVSIDTVTGQLYYQGTGSFTANSASYALSASYSETATSASYANNASTADSATSASYALSASYSDTATSASYANNASAADSASYALSASHADNADSATSASYALSASYSDTATSSSYANNASTADSATSASYANNASTADSATSASYALSSSFAVSASYAPGSDTSVSASYALSASYAETASYVNTLNQAVVISGSLSVNTTTGNSFDINADTFVFTGSFSQSGSVYLRGLTEVTRSYVVGFDAATGQLSYQTAVDNADTASFAISASYALTASYAESSSYATSASFASTASNVNPLTQSVFINGPLYLTGSGVNQGIYTDDIYPGSGTSGNRIFMQNTNSSAYSLPGDLVIYGSGGNVDIVALGNAVKINGGSAPPDGVQITGSLKLQSGATGSFTGSFVGDGSQLTGISASVLLNAVTGGLGISTFTFNGSAPAQVEVSGAANLSSGSLTLWTGAAFANSSISETTQVVINNAGGVLVQNGGLYVTGASTFHDAVVFQGDITVQGTASFQNSQNLAIADQFILLNSGSNTFQDSGFIINTGNTANSGSAFFLETSATTSGTDAQNGRFAVGSGVNPDATTVAAAEYMNTTFITGSAPGVAVPQWGGSLTGQGNTWVDSSTGDIYIYA
jgi:hypothetical protein